MFNVSQVAVMAIVLASASAARANTPEDVQGLGARANAMGGAGTALAEDFAATYYSPANLAFCRESSISLALRHTIYELDVDAAPEDPEPSELRNQTRVTVGVCNRLPFGFALGIVFGVGLQNPMTLDQGTLDARPRFVLYGEPLEQLSIQLGLAYRILDELSIGIGASILVSSGLAIDARIPVATAATETLESRIRWNLSPTASIVAGVHARPLPELRLALNYRSALFHDLDAPATIEVEAAGVFLDVPILIESAAWYSPQQVAFGVTYTMLDMLTFAFDLTWQDWSKHPGPFLIVTPNSPPGEMTVADGLSYAPREDYGFRDAIIPRVGVELRVLEERNLALRAGYGYRNAIAPLPSQTSNLLDSTMHSVTVGAGIEFGDDPDAPDAPPDGASAPAPQGPYVRGVDGRVAVFVRVSHMRTQQVSIPMRADDGEALSAYSFGGNVVDAGLELTLGWF